MEKGAKIWMGTEKEVYGYVQCLRCGYIYIVQRKIPTNVSVVKSCCPRCQWNKGLNCGDQLDDIYEFYDVTLDGRYYSY
jgi:hypothetical protein